MSCDRAADHKCTCAQKEALQASATRNLAAELAFAADEICPATGQWYSRELTVCGFSRPLGRVLSPGLRVRSDAARRAHVCAHRARTPGAAAVPARRIDPTLRNAFRRHT